MKNVLKNIPLALSVIALVVGGAVFLYRSASTVAADKPVKSRSFVAKGHNISTSPDGIESRDGGFTAYGGSSGQSRTDVFNGNAVKSTYCIPGLGAFTVREDALNIRGECNLPTARDTEAVIANSRNVKIWDDHYLGLPVKHTYREFERGGQWYSSEGWGLESPDKLMKLVEKRPDGSVVTMQIEEFVFTSVPDDKFTPPDLRPDFSWLESKLVTAKQTGDATLIAIQEQSLARLRLAFARRK